MRAEMFALFSCLCLQVVKVQQATVDEYLREFVTEASIEHHAAEEVSLDAGLLMKEKIERPWVTPRNISLQQSSKG